VIKLLIMAVCVVGAGALGFFGERMLRPSDAPAAQYAGASPNSQLLFKFPLGNFTMQIQQSNKILHMAFDIDVFVMGAKAFNNINGAVGRAKLRDGMVTAIAELAETDASFAVNDDDAERKKILAQKIVRKLYLDFPMVRTARINQLHSVTTLREPAGY